MALPSSVKLYVGNQEITQSLRADTDVTLEKDNGFKSLSFETDSRNVLDTLRLGNKVVLWDTNYSKAAFIGQVQTVRLEGYCASVTASRATRNRKYPSLQVFDEGTPALEIIQHALGQLCPDVYQGGIIDPGLQLVQASNNFALQTFEDVMQFVLTLSNSFATPLIWEVASVIGDQLARLNVRYLDLGPRWFVRIPLSQLEQQYDLDAQANNVIVAWGNREQYQLSPLSGIIDYSMLPIIVDKVMDTSQDVSTYSRARDLADAYLTRFNTLQDSNGAINLKCDDRLRVVPPLVTAPDDNYPKWLFDPQWVVEVDPTDVTDLTTLKPYNNMRKIAVASRYSFNSGEMVITTGSIGGLERDFNLLESYAVNRLYRGMVSPIVSFSQVNSDVYKVYGPDYQASASTPKYKNALPMFIIQSDGTLIYDGVIEPNLLADEGLEMNVAFGATTTGYKPSVKTIPGVYQTFDILLTSQASAFQVPAVSVVLTLFKNPVGTTTETQIHQQTCSAARTVGTLDASPVTFEQGDRLIVKVDTAGTETGLVASVALHGPKRFPDIDVTHS